MIEEIRHAAVKAKNGMILLGKSHADCFRQGARIGLEMSSRALDQGFFTSEGRFVQRPMAAQIATSAQQVTKPVKILFSEDLWSHRDGGIFYYDYIKGYHKTDAQQAAARSADLKNTEEMYELCLKDNEHKWIERNSVAKERDRLRAALMSIATLRGIYPGQLATAAIQIAEEALACTAELEEGKK